MLASEEDARERAAGRMTTAARGASGARTRFRVTAENMVQLEEELWDERRRVLLLKRR
jgi:hypothetical protein